VYNYDHFIWRGSSCSKSKSTHNGCEGTTMSTYKVQTYHWWTIPPDVWSGTPSTIRAIRDQYPRTGLSKTDFSGKAIVFVRDHIFKHKIILTWIFFNTKLCNIFLKRNFLTQKIPNKQNFKKNFMLKNPKILCKKISCWKQIPFSWTQFRGPETSG